MDKTYVSIPLKNGWKFCKGDDPAAAGILDPWTVDDLLDRAFAGHADARTRAPRLSWAAPSFDATAWRNVRVPHDWGIDAPFDPDRPYGDAFLDVSGVGWYRLAFTGSATKSARGSRRSRRRRNTPPPRGTSRGSSPRRTPRARSPARTTTRTISTTATKRISPISAFRSGMPSTDSRRPWCARTRGHAVPSASWRRPPAWSPRA